MGSRQQQFPMHSTKQGGTPGEASNDATMELRLFKGLTSTRTACWFCIQHPAAFLSSWSRTCMWDFAAPSPQTSPPRSGALRASGGHSSPPCVLEGMVGMLKLCFVGLSISWLCESKVWLVRLVCKMLMLKHCRSLLHAAAGACCSSVAFAVGDFRWWVRVRRLRCGLLGSFAKYFNAQTFWFLASRGCRACCSRVAVVADRLPLTVYHRFGVLGFGLRIKKMRAETSGQTSAPVLGLNFYPVQHPSWALGHGISQLCPANISPPLRFTSGFRVTTPHLFPRVFLAS